MVTRKLRRVYGYSAIEKINKAACGSHSEWGAKNVYTLVTPENPDLVVIAFGMNESTISGEVFEKAY